MEIEVGNLQFRNGFILQWVWQRVTMGMVNVIYFAILYELPG